MEVEFPRIIWVVAIPFFCAYWCGWPLPARRLPVGWLCHSRYHAFSSSQGWRPPVSRQDHAFAYAQMSPFQIGEGLWVFWNVCFHRHYPVSSSPILWMGAGEPQRGGWICWATQRLLNVFLPAAWQARSLEIKGFCHGVDVPASILSSHCPLQCGGATWKGTGFLIQRINNLVI